MESLNISVLSVWGRQIQYAKKTNMNCGKKGINKQMEFAVNIFIYIKLSDTDRSTESKVDS